MSGPLISILNVMHYRSSTHRSKRAAPKDVDAIEDRVERAEIFLDYLDSQWLSLESRNFPFPWPSVLADLRAEILKIRHTIERQKSFS
mgnify:CR=1 FL=1